MKTVVCCGYLCCDLMAAPNSYPKENQKQFIDYLDISVGGPSANAACLLAKWGVRTYLASQLGNDHFSEIILDDLRSFGVHIDYIQRYDGPCNCAVILSSRDNGSRTVLSRKHSAKYPRNDIFFNFKIDGLLVDGHQYPWSCHLLKDFLGISVLDAGSFRDETLSLLKMVSDPVASASFYSQFMRTQSNNKDEAHMLYKTDLVVTNGENPVLVINKDGKKQYSVFDVNVVDTLAAGDCFHGAYLFAKLYGLNTAESITLASSAAALCVSQMGGCKSIPSLTHTLAFLRCQKHRGAVALLDKIHNLLESDSRVE